jgi:hypothetical protein
MVLIIKSYDDEMYSPAQILGLSVRNPLETLMPVCFISFVLCCRIQVETLGRVDPPSKESHRLSIRINNYRINSECKKSRQPNPSR